MRGARLALLVAVAACGFGPRPPPAPPRRTQLGIQIARFDLTNGMRVVLVADPQMAEVSVTTRYQVGSVDDPPEHPGMAHLVEHLMYQQVLGAQSLFAHLETAATSFNGYTLLDATQYEARAHPSRLAELLSIEAVRVGFRCTSITDSVFERERAVVVNELRQRDLAREAVAAIHRAAYPDAHPYGRYMANTAADVAAITRDQACAFADAHYAPNNAVLVISGNLTPQQVSAALGKFLAKIPQREVSAQAPVTAVAPRGRQVEAELPLDEDAVLLAWPLPRDRQHRAQVRALAAAATQVIDTSVAGRVTAIELGDVRAPLHAVLVQPAAGETTRDVVDRARSALDGLPFLMRDERVFDKTQQGAIYDLYATLEDGSDRDARLASYLLAGQDPRAALADDFEGLRVLTRDAAAELAREHFAFERAVVVTLKSSARQAGRDVQLARAIHDLGQRRDPPDPEAAHVSAERPPTPSVAAMTTRVLPNGLRVVLLPITSVPTIELDLVFRAGTADEPADQRGAALVAGYGLEFDLQYLNDILLFAVAGGRNFVRVDTDSTTFGARGLDMHLDLLLAGLRRWVREGTYDSGDAVIGALRTAAKRRDGDDALADAWSAAVYGAQHPYAQAGSARHVSKGLTSAAAGAFRRAHYTPDNATLVIAGRFDPAVANRWIDFLFADWTGRAAPRVAPHTAPSPIALASTSSAVQAELALALPATAGDRAHRLVIAEMLAAVGGDVRHQLGASYGLSADLIESRLDAHYEIVGRVEAARLADAIQLLRDRIAALRSDPDAAARAFVAARDRVLTRLVGLTGSAELLARRVEHDVALGRDALSDLQTAAIVQALTIDRMTAALAELDLARAAVLLRGPDAETQRAFALLGRTPVAVHAEAAADVPPPPPAHDRSSVPRNLADAITAQRTPPAFTLTVSPSLVFARISDVHLDGPGIGGAVGYLYDAGDAFGIRIGAAHLAGHDDSFVPQRRTMQTFTLDAFAQAVGAGRVWGAFQVGLHVERLTEPGATTWHEGVGIGLAGGVDLVRLGQHRLGVCASVGGVLLIDTEYGGASLGVAYRFDP